jgi:ABC-type multidrug transport system fused ATPase/permease subunit
MDAVLADDVTGDEWFHFGMSKETWLIIVSLLIIVPSTLCCQVKIHRTESRIGGLSRYKLQTNLMRKFLSFDEAVRTSIKLSDLMLSITHHSPEIVSGGYMSIFKLSESFTKTLLLTILQILIASNQGSGVIWTGLLPAVVFPILMYAFVYYRQGITQKRRLLEMLEEKNLASQVETVCGHVHIITDYQRRGRVMDAVALQIQKLNKVINLNHVTHEVNMQFAPWLEALAIGLYVFFGGRQVLAGNLSFGSFVTTISIYGKVSDSITVIYTSVLVLHLALPALELIVYHMNLPTDLPRRSELATRSKEIGKELRIKTREELTKRREVDPEANFLFAVDLVPIQLIDICFHYRVLKDPHEINDTATIGKGLTPSKSKLFTPPSFSYFKARIFSKCFSTQQDQQEKRTSLTKGTSSEDLKKIIKKQEDEITNCNMEINQGHLVVLVGHRGQGKSTILRLLGGVLLPDSGDLFIPSHLRIIHVMAEPIFFTMTLLENLRYGVDVHKGKSVDEGEGSFDRIMRICNRLNMPQTVIDLIKQDEVMHWDEILSMTQKALLHLARALIANPNVLVIHKPTMVFNEVAAGVVMSALRSFVEDSGLEVQGERMNRRMRTCILTSKDKHACTMADRILCVSRTGISPVNLHDIDEAFFK